MYKINGPNDPMKEIKEHFRKCIEKSRQDMIKHYPEEIQKEMLEHFEKKDNEFFEELKKRHAEDNSKYVVKSAEELKKIDEELKPFQQGKSVTEIIDEKMDKYISEFEKKWGGNF